MEPCHAVLAGQLRQPIAPAGAGARLVHAEEAEPNQCVVQLVGVGGLGPRFAAAGIIPVMGAGSVSDEKQPEPIEPGSSVSMVLVQGDLNIAATCTVTYADADHLLACGHPVLQFGAVDIPMNKARVIATLPSPMNSFKIVITTETVCAFAARTSPIGRSVLPSSQNADKAPDSDPT